MLVAVAATAGTAAAQQHWYMRSNQGQPWGHTSNEDAMNMVFGQGNWTDSPFQNQPAADVFDDESECVFIDGSDFGANALNSYLQANLPLIESWVADGGRLFLNSAPNEGGNQNWGFGGVTLNYGFQTDHLDGIDPNHPIWQGPFTPAGTSYDGTGTHHAWITGGGVTNLAVDPNGNFPLAELFWGQGYVLFGGLTTDTWWTTQPNGHNARANMINYMCRIPAPGATAILGLAGLTAARRRR
jgi:hypothetical protein